MQPPVQCEKSPVVKCLDCKPKNPFPSGAKVSNLYLQASCTFISKGKFTFTINLITGTGIQIQIYHMRSEVLMALNNNAILP
jgi:hypothetical protein